MQLNIEDLSSSLDSFGGAKARVSSFFSMMMVEKIKKNEITVESWLAEVCNKGPTYYTEPTLRALLRTDYPNFERGISWLKNNHKKTWRTLNKKEFLDYEKILPHLFHQGTASSYHALTKILEKPSPIKLPSADSSYNELNEFTIFNHMLCSGLENIHLSEESTQNIHLFISALKDHHLTRFEEQFGTQIILTGYSRQQDCQAAPINLFLSSKKDRYYNNNFSLIDDTSGTLQRKMMQKFFNAFLLDEAFSQNTRFNIWFKGLSGISHHNMDAWLHGLQLIGKEIPEHFNESISKHAATGSLSKEQLSGLERAMLTNRFQETIHTNKRKAL